MFFWSRKNSSQKNSNTPNSMDIVDLVRQPTSPTRSDSGSPLDNDNKITSSFHPTLNAIEAPREKMRNSTSLRSNTFEDTRRGQEDVLHRLKGENSDLHHRLRKSRASTRARNFKCVTLDQELQETTQDLQRLQRRTNVRVQQLEERLKAAEDDRARPEQELQSSLVTVSALQINCEMLREEAETVARSFSEAENDWTLRLQQELQLREETSKQLQNENKDNEALRRELASSQKNLAACKDDLFRLQPRGLISDAEITRKLDTINANILSWIDREVDTFEATNPQAKPETIFGGGSNSRARKFMNKHPGAGECVARALIHQYLQEVLFANTCLVGLSVKDSVLIEEIEVLMTRLDPPRDSANIAGWRSETLLALSTRLCDGYTKSDRALDITMPMFEDLAVILPMLFTRDESALQFSNDITLPFMKLAIDMQTSTSRYLFDMVPDVFNGFGRAKLKDVNNLRLIDFATSKKLRTDSALTPDTKGSIGDMILPLEPALVRREEGKEAKVLRQGAFLINLFHPLGMQHR